MPKKVLLVAAVLLFLGFILFSYKVASSRIVLVKFDFDTTVKFQDRLPHKVDVPFSLISLIGSAEVTAVLWVLLGIYVLLKRYFWTALSLLLMPISILIELYGKTSIFHPSPPHFFYRGLFDFELPSKYYVQSNYSYPSGHVTRLTFLIVFVMIYFFYRTSPNKQIFIQAGLVIILIMVCVSRIYLGEHWTTDVIGGLFLGSSFGILSGLTIPRRRFSNG